MGILFSWSSEKRDSSVYVLLVRFKAVVYLNKLHIAISFSGQEAHVSVGVVQRNKNSENNRPRFVKDGDRYERRNDSADLLITINYNTVGISEHFDNQQIDNIFFS